MTVIEIYERMKCQLRNKYNDEDLNENAPVDFISYDVLSTLDEDAEILFTGTEGARNRNKFIVNIQIVLDAWIEKKKKALVAAHENPEGADEVLSKIKKQQTKLKKANEKMQTIKTDN